MNIVILPPEFARISNRPYVKHVNRQDLPSIPGSKSSTRSAQVCLYFFLIQIESLFFLSKSSMNMRTNRIFPNSDNSRRNTQPTIEKAQKYIKHQIYQRLYLICLFLKTSNLFITQCSYSVYYYFSCSQCIYFFSNTKYVFFLGLFSIDIYCRK